MNMHREFCYFSLISSFLIGSGFSEVLNVGHEKVESLTQKSLEYSEANKKDIGKKQETNGKTTGTTVSQPLGTKDQAQASSNRELIAKLEFSNIFNIFEFKEFLKIFDFDPATLNFFAAMLCPFLGNNLSSIDPCEKIYVLFIYEDQQVYCYVLIKFTESGINIVKEMSEKTKSSDKIEDRYWLTCLDQSNADSSLSVKEVQDLINSPLKSKETSTSNKNLVANPAPTSDRAPIETSKDNVKDNSIPDSTSNKNSVANPVPTSDRAPIETSKDNSMPDKNTIRIGLDINPSSLLKVFPNETGELNPCTDFKCYIDITNNNGISMAADIGLALDKSNENKSFSSNADNGQNIDKSNYKSNENKSFSINMNNGQNVIAYFTAHDIHLLLDFLLNAMRKATDANKIPNKKIGDAIIDIINIIKESFQGESLFMVVTNDKNEINTHSSMQTKSNDVKFHVKNLESVVNMFPGNEIGISADSYEEYNGKKIYRFETKPKNPTTPKDTEAYVILENNKFTSSSSFEFLKQQFDKSLNPLVIPCDNTFGLQVRSDALFQMSRLITHDGKTHDRSTFGKALDPASEQGKFTATACAKDNGIRVNIAADYPMIKAILEFINFIQKMSNEQVTKRNETIRGPVPAKGNENKKPAFLPAKEDSAKPESKFVPSTTLDTKVSSPAPIKVTYDWDMGIRWEDRQILIPVKILTESKAGILSSKS
ncbi:MAG: hypothetical protein LBJ13_02120 [Puniceicoccales bacterium]|nr:hypothetical protein [Puniceicoccales bacterium]